MRSVSNFCGLPYLDIACTQLIMEPSLDTLQPSWAPAHVLVNEL